MPTTCLICCQQAQYFLSPPCNHKQMCWKCSITLIEGSTFSCPYCKGTPQGTSCILFVNQQEMKKYTFQQILNKSPYKSATKSYQYYSNQNVAHFIQQSISNYCRLCCEIFDNLNILKKHLNQIHRKQYCDVCLESRKCLFSQQMLYSQGELTSHLKKGQYSHTGQLILYHPYCDFCKVRFYDIDSFKAHIRISSHLKCHICQQNFPKLKYVYYKDFQQMQKHFQKSHFICDIGLCVGKKLQNVYASQHLLQQHKMRMHTQNHKHGNNKNIKPIMNLILFQGDKQQQLQWDKIGKDFNKQFTIVQKNYTLKNQQHKDTIIDIRQFYPQAKDSQKLSLQQIRNYLQQRMYKTDYKSRDVKFNDVPLFCPLQMSSLTRFELQKFIRSIYDPKYSEPMIQTFFTKRFNFNSTRQYLSDIRGKMRAFSPISYFYVFPQLVRFMKDTNTAKQYMDQYYAETLRELKINRIFIFHKKQRYSQILNILQQQIQAYIYQNMLSQKININIYQTYLKDLNPSYYQNHHRQIFYVQKQKIKNMYHMVQKTKTKQLLKLNWLLKLGLSNQSYKIIYDKFYYKTDQECNQAIKLITLQQLALLYAYTDICLQALIDKKIFNDHKSNPPTFFLSTILQKVKTCISMKQLTTIKQLQNKSIQIAAKLNSYYVNISKKKGIVINQQQHPTLLNQYKDDKKQQDNLILFGKQWQPSGKSRVRVNKKNNNNKQQDNAEDFPQLFINKKNKQISNKDDQDDFPVYNFNQKKNTNQQANKKLEKKKKFIEDQQYTSNIDKLDLFNTKNDFPSRRKAQEYYKQLERQQQNKKNIRTKEQIKNSQKWAKLTNQKIQQQDTNKNDSQSPKVSKKKRKKQNDLGEVAQKSPTPPKIEEKFEEEMIIKKKTKQQLKAEQENQNKKNKKKNKNEKQKQISKQSDNQQQEEQKPKKVKKRKVRLDMTSSSQQQRRKQKQLQAQRQQKLKKFEQQQKFKQSLRYHEGFDSLVEKSKKQKQKTGPSIINALIEESQRVQIKQTEVKIRKGRKGKAIVSQRVDLSKL